MQFRMLTSKSKNLTRNTAESGATTVAPDLATADQDFESAAQTIALNALAVRAKSRGEIAAHLKRRGIPDDAANVVLDRLERSGLINDLDFARAWSTSRLSSKKISKRVLAQELRKKCVADDLIAQALDEISGDDEYEAALHLGQRKARALMNYSQEVRERRIVSALARKGYNFGIINRVLREVNC